MNDVVYKASEWGNRFHNLRTNEALGAGSAGPGKTWVLIADPLQQIMIEHLRCARPNACHEPFCQKSGCSDSSHRHPIEWGSSVGWALHLRRLFPMLETTLVRCQQLFPKIDEGVNWNQQKHIFTFSSGYRFQLGHCKNDDDWILYHSQEFTHIAWDELVQFNEEQYEQINSRLRTSDPVLVQMLKVRAMSNPMMQRQRGEDFAIKDFHWVRRRFVDPEPAGNVVLKRSMKRQSDGVEFTRSRVYMSAKLSDNPDREFAKRYEEELMDKPTHIREALLNGNWYITADSFFGEDWNENLHVIEPFKVPGDWPQFRMLDWGFKKHGAMYWGALDEDHNLYLTREMWFRNMTAKVVAKRIAGYEKTVGLWDRGRSGIPGVADTQLWERRGDVGKSKAAEMAAEGITWYPADKHNHSRERNAERISAMLRDHDHGTSRPGLMIFRTCRNLRRTLPGLPIDPENTSQPLKGGDDHGYDAICYGSQRISQGKFGVSRNEIGMRIRGVPTSKARARKGRAGYGSAVL